MKRCDKEWETIPPLRGDWAIVKRGDCLFTYLPDGRISWWLEERGRLHRDGKGGYRVKGELRHYFHGLVWDPADDDFNVLQGKTP